MENEHDHGRGPKPESRFPAIRRFAAALACEFGWLFLAAAYYVPHALLHLGPQTRRAVQHVLLFAPAGLFIATLALPCSRDQRIAAAVPGFVGVAIELWSLQ